jgi:hypothetical protein
MWHVRCAFLKERLSKDICSFSEPHQQTSKVMGKDRFGLVQTSGVLMGIPIRQVRRWGKCMVGEMEEKLGGSKKLQLSQPQRSIFKTALQICITREILE